MKLSVNYDESISTKLTILENNNTDSNVIETVAGSEENTGSNAAENNVEEDTSADSAANKAVKTGDKMNLEIWIVLTFVSAAACTGVAVKRKDVKKDYSK